MKCNYCEHKKVMFNGRNNHYVVCGRTDGFVGYCKRGTTALYDEAPLPDWCPIEAEAEVSKLKAMLSAAVDTIEKISDAQADVCFMEKDSCEGCDFVFGSPCRWKHEGAARKMLSKDM